MVRGSSRPLGEEMCVAHNGTVAVGATTFWVSIAGRADGI